MNHSKPTAEEKTEIPEVQSRIKHHADESRKHSLQLEELKKNCSGSRESLRALQLAQSRKELHEGQRKQLERYLKVLQGKSGATLKKIRKGG